MTAFADMIGANPQWFDHCGCRERHLERELFVAA